MTLPATSLRKLSLRALSALALLPALALPLFASETASANCNVKINLKTDYSFDDEVAKRKEEANIEILKARIAQILETKGYSSVPGSSVEYVFSASSVAVERKNVDTHYADVALEVIHKGIEALGKDPETIPYLPGAVRATYEQVAFENDRSHWWPSWWSNWSASGKTLLQDVENLAKKAPECSELQTLTEPPLEQAYKELLRKIQANKDQSNTQFTAYVPDLWSSDGHEGAIAKRIADRYCLVKVNDPKCDYFEPGDYFSHAYSCSSNLEFKVKGDPRVFESTAQRNGYAHDRFNGSTSFSIVWNFPLLFIPIQIGAAISKISAYQDASTNLQNLVQSFSYCEK